jgi:hypothetical protein
MQIRLWREIGTRFQTRSPAIRASLRPRCRPHRNADGPSLRLRGTCWPDAPHRRRLDELPQDAGLARPPAFTSWIWDDDAPRITQILFPGAHADVGGGYPIAGNESGLSDGPLEWMTNRLSGLGVKFHAPQQVPLASDSKGAAHKPWMHIPWTASRPKPRPRKIPAGLTLHESVLARMKAGPVVGEPGTRAALYRPMNVDAYVAGVAA